MHAVVFQVEFVPGREQQQDGELDFITGMMKSTPGFVHGTPNYTWAFHNWLWQNGGDVFTSDLKKAAVNEPAGVEVAELLGSLRNDLKISPPGGVNLRDAFLAGKTAYWWAGSWNLTGLPEMKFEWSVAPTPTFFKQPLVWTISHNYVFPKPKAKDGVSVPVSLVYRKGVKRDGSAPLWLTGYGAYGSVDPLTFSDENLSLLERGVIVAEHRFGGMLVKRYEAERAVTIEREVAADMAVSVVSHAMWLGRELTAKEQLLR